VVYETNSERNLAIRVPQDQPQDSKTALLLAIAHVAQTINTRTDLVIEVWSNQVRDALIEKLEEQEDKGYVGTKSAQATKLAVVRLRNRTAATILVSPEHQAATERAEAAERLARISLDEGRPNPPTFTTEVGNAPTLSGAKLAALTQKDAYQGVREQKFAKYAKRSRSEAMMERAQAEAEDAFGSVPSEEKIWASLRHKDMSRECRHFLYRTMHDSYMVGSQWDREGFKDEIRARKDCRHEGCGGLDSMEHILMYCEAPGQQHVWALAKALWKEKAPGRRFWPGIGMILSSGMARFEDATGARDYGAERLYRILVTESANLIWALRCERVIPEVYTTHTRDEIEAKWYARMNERLSLDRELTNKRKYGKKAIKKKHVLDTWLGILESETDLPQDWTRECGVLVGIRSGLGDDVQDEEDE
jgi:hypothetical protein